MVTPQVALILKARDLKTTVDWYQTIGFQLRAVHPQVAPTWAEVERDGLVVQFLSGDTPWDTDPVLTGSLYVHPPNVGGVFEEIKDKVTCEWGVEERPWGARELTLTDPDGYFVTFTEPMV